MQNDIFYLGIVGSRSFNDYDKLCKIVSKTIEKLLLKFEKVVLVSGGANGADKLAKRFADEFNYEIIEYLADWENEGKSAGFNRNHKIIGKSDLLIAFWDGKSKGTLHSMKLMNIKIYNRLILVRF